MLMIYYEQMRAVRLVSHVSGHGRVTRPIDAIKSTVSSSSFLKSRMGGWSSYATSTSTSTSISGSATPSATATAVIAIATCAIGVTAVTATVAMAHGHGDGDNKNDIDSDKTNPPTKKRHTKGTKKSIRNDDDHTHTTHTHTHDGDDVALPPVVRHPTPSTSDTPTTQVIICDRLIDSVQGYDTHIYPWCSGVMDNMV